MKKRALTLIIVMAVFAVLAAAYFIYDAVSQSNAPLPPPAPSGNIVVAEDDYRKTTALSYEWQREKIALTYNTSTGKWIYDAQPKLPVDLEIPSHMAAAISQIQASRLVESSRERFDEYGLNDPTLRVSIWYETGEERSYIIGGYNSFSDNYYFNVVGTDDVYMIAPGLLPYFEYTLLDLLTLDTIPQLKAQGTEVKSVTADGTPLKEQVSGGYIDTLSSVELGEAVGWAVTEEELRGYGFDEPVKVRVDYTIAESVSNEEGSISSTVYSDRVFELDIGGTAGDGLLYCKTPKSPVIYAVREVVLPADISDTTADEAEGENASDSSIDEGGAGENSDNAA